MHIYNSTECYVVLNSDKREIILKPYENRDIDCTDKVIIELKHNYLSSAMSKSYIAHDHNDDSIISLAFFSHKEPYFNLVLDCKYEIICTEKTKIDIKKEIIRPSYFCSYDRFFPVINEGVINIISHTFGEKQNFENHYIDAISNSNKKIITILLIILALMIIPVVFICFLSNFIGGLIAVAVALIFLLLVRYFGLIICKIICRADCKLIFSDFDSCRIIKYFDEWRQGDGSKKTGNGSVSCWQSCSSS